MYMYGRIILTLSLFKLSYNDKFRGNVFAWAFDFIICNFRMRFDWKNLFFCNSKLYILRKYHELIYAVFLENSLFSFKNFLHVELKMLYFGQNISSNIQKCSTSQFYLYKFIMLSRTFRHNVNASKLNFNMILLICFAKVKASFMLNLLCISKKNHNKLKKTSCKK